MHPANSAQSLEITPEFISRLVKNFEDKVLDKVPVPWRHTDDPRDNTGYVLRLIQTSDGLDVIIDAMDEAAADRIAKGLVPGISARIDPNYLHKETGKRVGPVLLHAALVDNPYIKKMRDFEPVALSDGGGGGEFFPLVELSDQNKQGGIVLDLSEIKKVLKEKHNIDLDDLSAKVKDAETAGASLSAVREALKAGQVDLAEGADLAEAVKGLLARVDAAEDDKNKAEGDKTQLSERVATLENQLISMEAEKAVEVLLSEGKVVPAEKDEFVKLYKKDKELFEGLTSKLTVKVDLSERGVNASAPTNTDLSDDQIQAEIDRIANAHLGQQAAAK